MLNGKCGECEGVGILELTVEMTTARMMLAITIKAPSLRRTIRVNLRRRLMLTRQRSCVAS